jgi:predicted transcriptional regulator
MSIEQSPTSAELEVLQILWQLGPSPVREVNKRMNESRQVGYTTTLKTMQIMHKKGLLSRRKESRTHIYSPLVDEKQVKDQFIDELAESAFKGSAMQLVMHTLGRNKASSKELQAIKELIESKEQKED